MFGTGDAILVRQKKSWTDPVERHSSVDDPHVDLSATSTQTSCITTVDDDNVSSEDEWNLTNRLDTYHYE